MIKKLFIVLLCSVLLISGCSGEISGNSSASSESTVSDSSSESGTSSGEPNIAGDISTLSTIELVEKMGYGINLGNTLEACGDWINPSGGVRAYETAWGSPVITKEAVNGYAAAEFGILRIPVAWSNLMSTDGNYTISPDYIARVKEVVGWTLDAGMLAIINIHYDSGWVNVFPENKDESMRRFTVMWEQIAKAFGEFDERLVFESQNEELGWNSVWNQWGGSDEEKKTSFALVNEVNQAFVNVVRKSGGNNPQRHLLISGYNTNVELTCDELFVMPDDPANRLAVSVHYYEPSVLTILEEDADWGKARTDWGSDADIAALERHAAMLKNTFIDKGVPVIVGEYGCFGKNKTRGVKEQYMLDVASRMHGIGACPILWDTPGDEYDRTACAFRDPEFIKALVQQ